MGTLCLRLCRMNASRFSPPFSPRLSSGSNHRCRRFRHMLRCMNLFPRSPPVPIPCSTLCITLPDLLSAQLPQLLGRIPPSINPRLANQVYTKRSDSTPDMLAVGNIVYQTPTSPAASRHPISPEKTPSQLGPLLPSFLKHEIKPARARSPSSLSPSSASSADLSFDEFDDELSSPTRRMAALNFYTQKNVGSGRLSNDSGSTSSLTLGGSMGGSIWSLDRNEDKAWSTTMNQSPELLVASRSRTSSFDALKGI